TRGVHAIPADWATAIAPARGTCLPTMAGHHVLEVADLLTRAAGEAPPDAGRERQPGKHSPAPHPSGPGAALCVPGIHAAARVEP
ncbi:hypothetical protein AB0J75_06185, partial [Streptomyces sp. NPDC049744]